MKPKNTLRHFLAAIGCATIAISSASAATRYWDTNGNTAGFGSLDGTWGNPTSGVWSSSPLGTNNTINNARITALDDINFGTAADAYSGIVSLSVNQSARSMTFAGSSVVTMQGNGTARTLALGSGGLTMNNTSSVTLGDGVAGNNLPINLGAFGQTWTNNTANDLTILNTAATFSRVAGGTLTFNKVGAGDFVMSTTVLNNDATGIVGPWALFGSGTNTRYAFNNAGTIAGYSGGTTAAGAEDFTSATTNYDFDGSGTNTLTDNRTAHTIRYTGTGNVIDLGAAGTNTLTANGILAVGGSGTLTIQRTGGTGTLVAGSTGANSELVIAGPQNINITAPISNGNGNSTVTYSGTGTLTLSGDNTYTGGTRVNSGTLIANSATALGAAGGSLGVNGSGTLDLNGFDVNAGAFNGDNGVVTNTAVGDAVDFTVGTGNGAVNFAGLITGNLSMIKTGSGNLVFTGINNTFTGGFTVAGGNISGVVGGTDPFGVAGGAITVTANTTWTAASGAINLNKSLAVNSGTLTFVHGNNRWEIQGVVSGSGTIKVNDAGGDDQRPLRLINAANTFNGAIDLTNNRATINVASLGDSAGAGNILFGGNTSLFYLGTEAVAPMTLTNRAFEFQGGATTATILNKNTADSNANTLTINSDLSVTTAGAKTLRLGGANTGANTFDGDIVDGSGTVSLTKIDAGKWVLSGANTYTGNTTVFAGILEIGGSGTLGNVSAGVGDYAGNIAITNTSSGRLVYNSSASQTLSGVVSGTGAVFVEAGTLALANTNTYTGATTVNGGTLLINGSTSSTSVVTVNTGGTLGGSGTVGGATTVNGFLNPGTSPGVLSFSTTLALGGTAATTMEINGSVRETGYDGIDVGTALTYGGSLTLALGTTFGADQTFNLFDLFTSQSESFSAVSLTGSYTASLIDDGSGVWSATTNSGNESWVFTQSTGDLALVVIPEPTTALLGGLGLLALLRRRR